MEKQIELFPTDILEIKSVTNEESIPLLIDKYIVVFWVENAGRSTTSNGYWRVSNNSDLFTTLEHAENFAKNIFAKHPHYKKAKIFHLK